MASQAMVVDVASAQPFDNAGTAQVQLTLNVILVDIAGCKSQKTTVSVNVGAADTSATIQTNIVTAVQAKATALGYSVGANATLIPQFNRQ